MGGKVVINIITKTWQTRFRLISMLFLISPWLLSWIGGKVRDNLHVVVTQGLCLSVSAWSLSSVLFDWLRAGNHVMFRALIKNSDIYFHTEISFNPWQNIIIEYFSIKKIFIISFLTHKSDLSETILTLWIHFSHPHSQRTSISICYINPTATCILISFATANH